MITEIQKNNTTITTTKDSSAKYNYLKGYPKEFRFSEEVWTGLKKAKNQEKAHDSNRISTC